MYRNILKRFVIMTIFSIFAMAAFFEIAKLIPNPNKAGQDQHLTGVFSNTFFNNTLSGLNTAEEMVSMTTIHNKIVEFRNNMALTPTQQDNGLLAYLQTTVGSKRISIGTADELYNFSAAVAYNWTNSASENNVFYRKSVTYLLSRSYALVADIDYRALRARKFIPIGIDIDLDDDFDPETSGIQTPFYPFTGQFDGQGFTISNLYVADYSYIIIRYRFSGEETYNEFAVTRSYSMFSHIAQSGVVKNLNIVNPNFELLDSPEDLTKAAMLAGVNEGLIYNVSVIDNKVNALGNAISGIAFNALYVRPGTSANYTAAGFVHTNTNTGKIYNSFLVTDYVMTPSSTLFTQNIKPFVFDNTGDILGSAYNSNLDSAVSSTVQPGIFKYTKNEFIIGKVGATPISINAVNLTSLYGETRNWNFYDLDGYPQLFKLNYVGGAFEIANEYDLIAFNKLINFETKYPGSTLSYNEHNYRLTANIDMKNLIGYQTPLKNFSGVFSGGTSEFFNSSVNDNKYISNLKISRPAIIENGYYMGLFSTVSGTVRNLNLSNGQMTLTQTLSNYGREFNVGSIAGELLQIGSTTPILKNIVTDVDIDLGSEAVGRSNVGGIVGKARGSITYVANLGNIDGGLHDFDGLTINPIYNIGGLVGATSEATLVLTNSVNKGNISSIGLMTNKQFNVPVNVKVINRVGGIIGDIHNITGTNHSVYYVTNQGAITANDFAGKSNGLVEQYLGGIFGEVRGFALQTTNNTNPITFRNGRWENQGILYANHVNIYTTINGAGIGVVSTTSTKAHFSYMINKAGFDYSNLNYGNHNTYLFYSATVLNNSTGGIKLSRAYNTANFTFGPTYFASNSSINVDSIKIAPFFVSKNEVDSELNFVENQGEILVGSTTGNSNVVRPLYVAGITLSNKIDYKDVIYSGTQVTNGSDYTFTGITLLKINNTAEVFVSGITYALPYDTAISRPYLMENVINKGNIIVADFLGMTNVQSLIFGSFDGTSGSATGFTTTLTSRNLYVAGVVNINVGEIRNAMNYGMLTSTYNSSIQDIDGTANTFAGGITTFNYNLIQDAANTGLLHFINSNDNSISYVSSSQNPASSGALFAGMTYGYNGGVVLGGISAALANPQGTVLTGIGYGANVLAEVLDTSNNGNIYGKSRYYVRVGGIVGVALGIELTAGTDNATSVSNSDPAQLATNDKRFSSNMTGSQDPIAAAKVSNGLNFGNIYGVSYQKYNYTSMDQRPGIYSAAGGVVGYGLFAMKRMLNHGTIAATDVAGGIVGATYIVGTNDVTYPVSIVDIDTAVHYGRVRALDIDNNTGTTGLNKYINMTYESLIGVNGDSKFKPQSYLFPTGITPQNIANKPAFGGIFGKLQRGTRGAMQSNNFVNILNMDPDIDMVGRTDQNALGSYAFYRFSVVGKPDTYYSARTPYASSDGKKDTSPTSFVGYTNYGQGSATITSATSVTYRISRYRPNTSTPYTYTVTEVFIQGAYGTESINYTRQVGLYTTATINNTFISNAANHRYSYTYNGPVILKNYGVNATTRLNVDDQDISAYGLTTSDLSGASWSSNVTSIQRTGTNIPRPFTITYNLTTTGEVDYEFDKASYLSTPPAGVKNIFDSSFPLMNPTQSDFIYRADNVVLPDIFKNDVKFVNGMYVLASTKGRAAGAVLPANLKINNFYGLKEPDTPVYYDLDNIKPSQLNVPTTNVDNDSLYKAYTSMFQVRKNDKSLILNQNQSSTLGQITLYDPNNGSPLLEGGTIVQPADNNNNPKFGTIDFYVSRSAFPTNLTGYTVNYEVLSAELSENAVIAKSNVTLAEHANLKLAYQQKTSNIIGDAPYSSLKFNYSGGFVDNKIIFDIWVYSEIAVDDYSLLNRRTVYTVTIHLIPDTLNVSLNQLRFDSVNITPLPTLVSNTYTVTSQELNTDGTVHATFLNPNTQLPIGHKITVYGLYKDSVLVDTTYTELTINPKNTSNLFGFSMKLSDNLVSGLYEIRFSYYNTSTVISLIFEKGDSTLRVIQNVSYTSFSSNANGSLDFIPVTSSFTTFIEFGYVMEGVLRDVSSNLTIETTQHSPAKPAYLNQVKTHDFKLNGNTLLFVELSPFAYITNATIRYTYITGGIKEYIVQYRLYNEADSYVNITHTIRERIPSDVVVYKNGNQQFARPVPIAREEITTTLRLDFNFLDNLMYNDLITFVNGSSTLPTGMQIANNQNYFINIDSSLNTGLYTLSFALQRETDVVYNLPSLGVIKNLGISAYLSNIKFQVNSDIITRYPNIYQIDSTGAPVVGSLYDIRAFFGGIDYNNADTNSIRYFRIDGEITDLELSSYHPQFTLPQGAVIQRQVSPGVWSNDIFGNFTSEVDDQTIVIRYRILSETTFNNNLTNLNDITNDNTIVYYDLTVFDNLYNLTLRFTLFYRNANGDIMPASDTNSLVKNSVILINLKNYTNSMDNFSEPTTIDPLTGRVVYPYEGSIIQYTPIVNTQSTLFYYPLPSSITKYVYSFGKNESGVYNFTVVTPKYTGTTNGNLVNGLRFDYSIYIRTGATGPGIYPWNQDKYKLPEFDSTGKIIGKYYYVLTNRQIIREFAIVIEHRTVGNQWGLYDDYTSWDGN